MITMTQASSPRWKTLIGFIFLIFFVQLIGNLSTMPEIKGWYASLTRPGWTPPNWLFGPVWTILYGMIAVAGWLLWEKLPGDLSAKLRYHALRYYFIQLVLNFLWSPLFFKWHLTEIALIDILALIAFVFLTIRHAYTIDRKASYLLVPYLAWLTYAMTLNAGIVYLN